MQSKIQQAQDNYGRLLELQKKLADSIKDWQEAAKLAKELETFYQQPEWIELHDNSDSYAIDTKGNFSVLSEDAIWNALWEQKELAGEVADIAINILRNK
ncbi:DUF4298 domain-containing protein [Muribacter muris]|uniref:DUF4298 domain-containing protein n=1 Tax=Muribacter muris TaxID=67855 RepID=A0A4Y9K365_9PAST|nr:DUF4298 domain-containing protein [Muribacter muris]MBF0784468.1 DUF4298 domain-containing protein [Muribacter muris]MBF0826236.1 DUF4298 domain-containing protein [Muribacter muris]TFV11982.1 DUF4298 domain-containing protein [Muribacter muris]